MEQYLQLLRTIKEKGCYKPAARSGMPGTQSLFGYQFRHNLQDGFPLLTTKKIFWKGVVTELLWFLRGDTNIKYLVDNGVNIWNEDAFNYYLKGHVVPDHRPFTFEEFIQTIKGADKDFILKMKQPGVYQLGDCGYQYGKLWRKWDNYKIIEDLDHVYGGDNITNKPIDQIKELIEGLKNNSESRRHIITAWNPATLDDMALNACHCLVQFNCRPLTLVERCIKGNDLGYGFARDIPEFAAGKVIKEINYYNIPKYYLDCQLYQRSADAVLGVPFNIASYALLTHILAKVCNMIPGEFIHTFGDVHCYDTHRDQVEIQLQRQPFPLPTLNINWDPNVDFELVMDNHLDEFIESLKPEMFVIENYKYHPSIKSKLSTGLK